MLETVVSWILAAVGVYVLVGVLFAVPFVLAWVKRVDPDAEHGSWGFRVLIFPGTVALWPLMWRRVRGGPTALPVERSPHRDAAR
jgi:hypothetical protein